ncbi:hypothetical protein [Polymorphobacter sp.]|uniref:hypothetical protein n=1 Tax=Polymorphobacter sp. TaxID=1909290 RepID=UPI003F6FEDA6
MADQRATRTAAPSVPVPGRRPFDDDLLAMLVAVTSELTVVRARQDAMERLLHKAGVLAADAVDSFTPDDPASAARAAERQRVIANVFRAARVRAEAEGESL